MFVEKWEIVDHGIEHSQYFQGCGVSFTDYDTVVTGIGENYSEALDDAIEQLAAIGLVDNLESVEADIKMVPGGSDVIVRDEGVEDDERWYYVSVRIKFQRERRVLRG